MHTDGIQIYSAICTLQLEFWEFKYDIFACELLVDTSESLHLEKKYRGGGGGFQFKTILLSIKKIYKLLIGQAELTVYIHII